MPNISSELDHDADGDYRVLFMQNANYAFLLFLSDEQRSLSTSRTAIYRVILSQSSWLLSPTRARQDARDLALSDLGYSFAKAAEPLKMGCTKNSTRGIGTASNSGFVDNEKAARCLGGLKAAMPRSSVQRLSDFPGSLHYSGGLLETS